MQHTPNYNLNKPGLNDYVNIEDLNENADIIDQELQKNADGLTTHLAEKATLTTEGHTQLSNSTTSTSNTLAATPSAVKQAYDLANSKQNTLPAEQKRPIYISSTAPTNPQEGDIWIEVD